MTTFQLTPDETIRRNDLNEALRDLAGQIESANGDIDTAIFERDGLIDLFNDAARDANTFFAEIAERADDGRADLMQWLEIDEAEKFEMTSASCLIMTRSFPSSTHWPNPLTNPKTHESSG